jgi:hypothetical protein
MENNNESGSVNVELDYTDEQEALVHSLTQDNETEILSHSVLSSVKRPVDDINSSFENIFKNPELLKRLKHAFALLDKDDTNMISATLATASFQPISSSTDVHMSTTVSVSSVDTERLADSAESNTERHLLIHQLSQETRDFLLSKYNKEIVNPLLNVRKKLRRIESNTEGLTEAIKYAGADDTVGFPIASILSSDIPACQYNHSLDALVAAKKEMNAAIRHFYQYTKNTALHAFHAAESELLEQLSRCSSRFATDAVLFLNSIVGASKLTTADKALIQQLAVINLLNELQTSCMAAALPQNNTTRLLLFSTPSQHLLVPQISADRCQQRDAWRQAKHKARRKNQQWQCAQIEERQNWVSRFIRPSLDDICPTFFHNLSNTLLSHKEITLLNNGLKFIVAPPCLHDKFYLLAFDKLARSIRLKYQFLTTDSQLVKKLFIPNPEYMPADASHNIETYIRECHSHLLRLLTQFPANSTNNTKQTDITRIVKELENKNLVIKPADKNLGPVVMKTAQYNKFCLDILQDCETYRVIVDLPSINSQYEVLTDILNQLGISLTSNTAKFLLQGKLNIKTVNAAKFYVLPKMHKMPIVGRPIVSNINYITYYASRWLHVELEPLLANFPSYLKDSKQAILELEQLKVSKHCILVAADVTNLYPSIPTPLGLFALREVLSKETNWSIDKIEMILKLSAWVLNNMYITFDDKYYLQTNGTAMGTPFAVVYAIIYLHYHESTVLSKLRFKPIYFKRFIDDIFLIVQSKEQGNKFLDTYNDIQKNIILTSNSGTSVDFLDITIFKGPRLGILNILDIKTFQKPQNKYLYIPPTSYHDSRVFSNLIASELKRYCITCSVTSDFTAIKQLFFERLIQRGYSRELIAASSDYIIFDRNLMLTELRNSREQVRTMKTTPESFRFIFQNNPRNIPFKKEGWGSIPDFVLQDQFSYFLFDIKRPIIFVKKNPPSLSKLLC